jgi:CRISPR-associated protein Csc2
MAVKLSTLARYQTHLLDHYENFPHGRYVSLIVVRKTESETIFRTEGSGEGLVKETVIAGIQDQRPLRRVVITKRKQTAVERRTGRELLREQKMLKHPKDNRGRELDHECALNTNQPCEQCIDCMLYGFAVGGGGAQKARVITDDAFSLAPVSQVTDRRTFNATYDNSTMRSPLDGKASTSINEDEYVRPETHFLDIETLKDVTIGELQYVIGNILRSTRYGAISSRLGRVKNTIAAIVFSDCELFSNLELTQAVYDRLPHDEDQNLPFPLADRDVETAIQQATDHLLARVVSRTPVVVRGQDLDAVRAETVELYRSPEQVKALLEEIDAGYSAAARQRSK